MPRHRLSPEAKAIADKFYSQIGMRIRHYRIYRRLYQRQLAHALNISAQTINSIEKGRTHYSFYLAYRIANILNVKIADLMPSLMDDVPAFSEPFTQG